MQRPSLILLAMLISVPVFAEENPKTVVTPAFRYWVSQMAERKVKGEKLEARLKELSNQPGADTRSVPQEVFCPLALESALAVAGNQGRIVGDEAEAFHLIINSAGGDDPFDLFYTFSRAGKLLSASVGNLPRGWELGFFAKESGKYMYVTTDKKIGCVFQFGLTDPFDAFAMKNSGQE